MKLKMDGGNVKHTKRWKERKSGKECLHCSRRYEIVSDRNGFQGIAGMKDVAKGFHSRRELEVRAWIIINCVTAKIQLTQLWKEDEERSKHGEACISDQTVAQAEGLKMWQLTESWAERCNTRTREVIVKRKIKRVKISESGKDRCQRQHPWSCDATATKGKRL